MQEFLPTELAIAGFFPIDLQGWGDNLLVGLGKTMTIAFGAFTLGLFIGLNGALGKLYGPAPLRWFLELYTTVIRAVPELVLILLLYYAGTDLLNRTLEALGYRPLDISGVAAGVAVLGVVMGAYSTEVIRAAIRAVPPGQMEAGRAYGMSGFQVLRRVTIPAMLPFAIPGLSNLWLIVTKDTALLAVVGFEELASVTRQAAGTTRDYLFFFCVAFVIYLCVTLVSNVIIRWIENYYRRGQHSLEKS